MGAHHALCFTRCLFYLIFLGKEYIAGHVPCSLLGLQFCIVWLHHHWLTSSPTWDTSRFWSFTFTIMLLWTHLNTNLSYTYKYTFRRDSYSGIAWSKSLCIFYSDRYCQISLWRDYTNLHTTYLCTQVRLSFHTQDNILNSWNKMHRITKEKQLYWNSYQKTKNTLLRNSSMYPSL